MDGETLCAVDINTLRIDEGVKATPYQNLKRKQDKDDYTPQSRHIDKRGPASEENQYIPSHRANQKLFTESPSVFHVDDGAFDASASIGSVLSQPDFTASVRSSQVSDSTRTVNTMRRSQVPEGNGSGSSSRSASSSEQQRSPKETPRPRDVRISIPRSTANIALGSGSQKFLNSTPCVVDSPHKSDLEVNLISFQTPGPQRSADGQTRLQRFRNDEGEEMLLDMTPRVYSPRSIPIYTLQDLDQIKTQFQHARKDLEMKVESLHLELAASISHSNHHKALAVQSESLHSEYSKKHVRKVTALKADWERKALDKLSCKDEVIAERDSEIAELKAALELERDEKREVIVMAEAVLALQAQQPLPA